MSGFPTTDEEIKQFLATHPKVELPEKYKTPDWIFEKSEKSVPKGLEEAAEEYEKKHTYQRYDGGGLTPEYDATLAESFIAGAKWDRKQMMVEAVEGIILPKEGVQ